MGFVAELGGEFSTLVASKLRMPSDRDDLIVALYEQGVPVAEIAERTGVCVKTVRRKRELLAQIAGRTA
jgi:DNA-directed RNA polymerase specialized sigma24 family protein